MYTLTRGISHYIIGRRATERSERCIPMSLLALRVELPSYSHSFQISVPVASTVLDVKQAIFESCAGSPRVEGQRIVWRGRFLGDAEKVADIWKVRRGFTYSP